MRTHWVVSLCGALAICLPAVAAETATSYSLNELRELARSAHPTLESAEAAVAAAAGSLREARAYPNPGLSVTSGRGRPRDGGDSRSETAIELAQPIELPGARRWRRRLAELGAQGAALDREVVRAMIDTTVTRLAYTELLERRRAEIVEESVRIAARLLELLDRRVELGESSPLEAVKARSEWFARRSEVVDVNRSLAATRSALNLVCGGRLSRSFEIAETLEGPGAIPLPPGLAERLRERSPVLMRSGLAVEEARAHIEAARKERFPRFDVIAAHETELDKTATSLGVGLTIPLWNRGSGRVAAATAGQVRADADRRGATRELETALARAVAAYEGARSAIGLHEEGWTDTAEQALAIATFSYENGEASLLDVLDAQRSYLGVRSAEAESWAALALARVEIEQLLDGPLQPEKTDETR